MWPYPFQQVTDRFDLSKGCSPDQRRETSLVTFIYQVLPCTKPDILNRKVKTPLCVLSPPCKASKGCKTKPRVYQRVLCELAGLGMSWDEILQTRTFPKVLLQLAELTLSS